ncbi:MAG: FAD-dependent oxidoreductase [Candidatus Sumerlaeia bacterium]
MANMTECDVLVAGGGTAGVFAALAAARNGAKTVLVESKGYLGGIAVEGGTALHSFYNLWKAFPGVEKKQLVHGMPEEFIERLMAMGGCSGHAETMVGYDYDSVCTAIDTEIYKLAAFEVLEEAGVDVWLNSWLTGARAEGGRIESASTHGRSGAEEIRAKQYIDTTGYGDLAGAAGASYTDPNDYAVANSMGVGGVDVEAYYQYLKKHDAVYQYSLGVRDGEDGKIVRLDGIGSKLPEDFVMDARSNGMALVITTTHDGYFMFVKLNVKLEGSPLNRADVTRTELELRRRQYRAVEIIRKHIPGAEKAFIARTSPSLCIRRGRCIECDYDISPRDVLDGIHFDDDVATYGFHDFAPRLKIKNGGSYGIPYRALRPKAMDNLLVGGMMITSDHEAHMSTRNTVSCMIQGQAAGTAAALCADKGCTTRELDYGDLRKALIADNVYLEN